jgi:hypothetical protein
MEEEPALESHGGEEGVSVEGEVASRFRVRRLGGGGIDVTDGSEMKTMKRNVFLHGHAIY